MNPETIYQQAAAAYIRLGANGDGPLPKLTLAHYPIDDTALAACILCLGIPPREPGPYTDCAQLTESGSERVRKKQWWVGSHSPDGTQVTEWLIGAWIMRSKFESEHALHQLVSMRAGFDAREWWLHVLHAKLGKAPIFPDRIHEPFESIISTTSIREAAILKACGFTPLAMADLSTPGLLAVTRISRDAPNSKLAFVIRKMKGALSGLSVLEESENPGSAPPQCMNAAIRQYTHMVKIAKGQAVIMAQPIDGQTLLLTADATRKTRELFHRQL